MRSIIITLIAMLTLSQRAGAENTATGIFHPDFRTLTIALEGNRLAPAYNNPRLLRQDYNRL